MKKVLAFFGAFNPPTNAHIDLAELAMKETGREQVVFVPSKAEYIVDEQKKEYAFEDAFRLDMLGDLQMTRPWMDICRHDMESETQPRTYETLCWMRDHEMDPTLLVGSDVLFNMESKWENVNKIAKEFGIVCITRSELKFPESIQDDAFLAPFIPYITLVQAPDEYLWSSSSGARCQYDQALSYWERLCQIVPSEMAAHLLKDFIDVLLGGSHEA